jgi:site-specific DNA-methyltransferase (adenine-specific)
MDNAILTGDCLTVLPTFPAGCADLIYADPPFNIGLHYDGYKDRLPRAEYLDRPHRLLAACLRALAPAGSLFVKTAPRWARYVGVELDRLGLHGRSEIIWAYAFGPHQTQKFAPCHQPVPYYVRDPKRFTFNADAVRVRSRRQGLGDRRANPAGRVPGDLSHFPRLPGNAREWTDHLCQTPEAVLERIVHVASNPGDLVVDPCGGSGTACAVAAKLVRRWLGIEPGEEAAQQARRRVASVTPVLPGMAGGRGGRGPGAGAPGVGRRSRSSGIGSHRGPKADSRPRKDEHRRRDEDRVGGTDSGGRRNEVWQQEHEQGQSRQRHGRQDHERPLTVVAADTPRRAAKARPTMQRTVKPAAP